MSFSDELEVIVPKLRRFARASVGDVVLADDCVERVLKNLLETTYFEVDWPQRSFEFHLYRLLEAVLERSAGDSFEKKAWRALILVHVERFTPREAAQVLGIAPSEIEKFLRSAELSLKNAQPDEYDME